MKGKRAMTEQNNDGAGQMDRWAVVHQACYQAIRTCQQDKPADLDKVLWQIISPAVWQVFRNTAYEPGKQSSGNYFRIGDVVWMALEPDVCKHFLEITKHGDFECSVVGCFKAVCQAVYRVVTVCPSDFEQRIKKQMDLIRDTMDLIRDNDGAIQRAVSTAGRWFLGR